MAIRRAKILRLAKSLLEENGVSSAPVPIETIVKRCGLKLSLQDLDGDLSGFLYKDQDTGIVGVNSRNPRVRQRFTMAHELGHHLLHEDDPYHIDRAFYAKLRSVLSSQGTDEDEIEANLFAAELLMPREFLERDLDGTTPVDILDEDAIIQLAQSYDVSTQALMHRLTNLGYVEYYPR